MSDKLKEGIVSGDHGYDATNIASGESSGNIVDAGAGKSLKRKKKTKINRNKIKSVIVKFKD